MLADNMALRHSKESSTDNEPKKFTSHYKDNRRREKEIREKRLEEGQRSEV